MLSWEAYILVFPLPPSSCWTGKWVSSLIPPKTLLRTYMCMCGRFYCRLWRCRSYITTQGPLRTKGHSLKPLCHAGPPHRAPSPLLPCPHLSPSSLSATLALPTGPPAPLLPCPPPLPPGLTWEPHRAARPMELPVPARDAQAQPVSVRARAHPLQVAVEVIKQMIFLLWISSTRFVPDMWCPLPFFPFLF